MRPIIRRLERLEKEHPPTPAAPAPMSVCERIEYYVSYFERGEYPPEMTEAEIRQLESYRPAFESAARRELAAEEGFHDESGWG